MDAGASYPVQLDVRGRAVLVVGGGRVALRKVQGLLAAGAVVTVVAPRVVAELWELAPARITVHHRRFRSDDIDGSWLVVTCTDSTAVNATVAAPAEQQRVWVNAADDPANCAFTLPAVARQGPLVLTAATGGASPALARWFRRHWEAELTPSWLDVLDVLADARVDARHRWGSSEVDGWDEALDAGVIDLVRSGQIDVGRALLRRTIGLDR